MTRSRAPHRLLAALHLRAPGEAVVRLHGDLDIADCPAPPGVTTKNSTGALVITAP
ncbi:hypothetical protein [Kitasatospora sp. SolWspMP-SS2h]|uniref:hypothetical protein n=1 Tax=Kitasatospora sp. SolWspMP-SS2h TaxID=1305729 RepID=UPI001314A4E6|nr:hypothetical protein [Kitasatospora sp. SolWspMP-SS2h]